MPWLKNLMSSAGSSSSKSKSSKESKPKPAAPSSIPSASTSQVKAQPIPMASSSQGSSSAVDKRQSSTDSIDEALASHTATYGSSPSHATKKESRGADSDDEPGEEEDGDSPSEAVNGTNGAPANSKAAPSNPPSTTPGPTDIPTTQTILSNPLPTNTVSQLANQLSSTALTSSTTSSVHPAQNPNIKTFDIDEMISRLLDVGYSGKTNKTICLRNPEITAICQAAREVLLSQPTLIELSPPVKIVGDVHGQYSDLIRLFEMCGFPPSANYLFLGDYVDRGKQSLETILLLLCYKIKYPENFFLLRGNHECANVTRVYGFYDECKRRCSLKIWKTFIDVFNCLPIAAIVASKIFCVHGGLSPSLAQMDDIRKISRPTDVPDFGLLNDLLWSDPSDSAIDWEDNERGVSYCYGKAVIHEFLSRYDFDLICRAHMVVEDGYEFWNDRTLVTIFSAPNYCGEFDNFASCMSVSEDLLCAFELLKPLDGPALKKELNAKRRKSLPDGKR